MHYIVLFVTVSFSQSNDYHASYASKVMWLLFGVVKVNSRLGNNNRQSIWRWKPAGVHGHNG